MDKLAALCVDVNFVRNSRVDLIVSTQNLNEVKDILKANEYCITDCDRRLDNFDWMIRAV